MPPIGADAVVTMVADDEASRAVWLGKDGAAATMKAGSARDRMLDRVATSTRSTWRASCAAAA